jgi:multimeric flavodoxin WrbA
MNLLLIYGGHSGGRTATMVQAVVEGIARAGAGVACRARPALQAGIDDLLWAHGLLIGTPEHFGYMSGAVKDFMDRTYYPAEGKVNSLPYALFVSAGNDGSGAVSSIERIAQGYNWKRVAPPLIARGELNALHLESCRELGETFAAGLIYSIF